ncbi:unnamed protein product, partial [marine sediment metagenome]
MKLRLLFLLMIGFATAVATALNAGGGANYHQGITLTAVLDTADTTDDQYVQFSKTIGLEAQAFRFRLPAVKGRIMVSPAAQTYHGFGLKDSCKIRLLTSRQGEIRVLDSVFQAGLPCSLRVAIDSAEDTLIFTDLYLDIWIVDSTSDSIFTVTYP